MFGVFLSFFLIHVELFISNNNEVKRKINQCPISKNVYVKNCYWQPDNEWKRQLLFWIGLNELIFSSDSVIEMPDGEGEELVPIYLFICLLLTSEQTEKFGTNISLWKMFCKNLPLQARSRAVPCQPEAGIRNQTCRQRENPRVFSKGSPNIILL